MNRVVLIGASTNPERYSYKAFYKLRDAGYEVIALNPSGGSLEDLVFTTDIAVVQQPVYAFSIYVREEFSLAYVPDIVRLAPHKVILNPGTEGEHIEKALSEAGVSFVKACTLVLLTTGQFDKIVRQ